MLFKPYDNNTKSIMQRPIFFLGPIIIWFIIMILNPSGLIDFLNSGSHPDGFLAGLANGMSTKAGVSAMWAFIWLLEIFLRQNGLEKRCKKQR